MVTKGCLVVDGYQRVEKLLWVQVLRLTTAKDNDTLNSVRVRCVYAVLFLLFISFLFAHYLKFSSADSGLSFRSGWNSFSWSPELETSFRQTLTNCQILTRNINGRFEAYTSNLSNLISNFQVGEGLFLKCSSKILPSLPLIDFYGRNLHLSLIGQRAFGESAPDTVVPYKIFHAAGVLVDRTSSPNIVYVADTGNNRILGFRSLGLCGGHGGAACTNDLDCQSGEQCITDPRKNADLIIGQPNDWQASCNGDNNLGENLKPTASTLCLTPLPNATNVEEYQVRINFEVDAEGNLYFPDLINNRVLKYNQPFSGDKSGGKGDAVADFVLGQADLNSNGSNRGRGLGQGDAETIYFGQGPVETMGRGVSVDVDGNVWVADTINFRVLRFPKNSVRADLVLGQPDFTTFNRTNCSYSENWGQAPLEKMCTPNLAKINPETGELYVSEEYPGGWRTRILVFRPPFTNGMAASKVLMPKGARALNSNEPYRFRSSGFVFNTFKQGEYSAGVLWVYDHKRVFLLDADGSILKVIGSPDKDHLGCDFSYYGRCRTEPEKDFNLCEAGGGIGVDSANNLYFADEKFHRIARFSLPYNTIRVGAVDCLPPANGGLAAGTQPNAVSGYKFRGVVGAIAFGNQLIVKDDSRYLVWENYTTTPLGSKAAFVIGQSSEDQRTKNYLGARAYHVVDDNQRLWTTSDSGQVLIFDLPLSSLYAPRGTGGLVWADDGAPVNYEARGVAFDSVNRKIWLSDTQNHRLLRISNYQDFGRDKKMLVDMVLGQPDKNHTQCNHDQPMDGRSPTGPPTADSFCTPTQIEFDRSGNLYVVESSYETGGNERIVVYTSQDLASAQGPFPNLKAQKVFVRKTLTEMMSPWCGRNQPCSPVDIAFDKDNRLIIANDGYPTDTQENRPYRQLWLYNDPLKKDVSGQFVQGQLPDAYINFPLGAPGEISFDSQGNFIVQDHSWAKVWVLNLYQDPSLIVPRSN